MTVEKDDPRLVFIPLEDAIVAPDGLCNHFKDHWWSYDPERGLIFWSPNTRHTHRFPQCNGREHTARSLQERMYPWAETKFVPSVFIKATPQDYI